MSIPSVWPATTTSGSKIYPVIVTDIGTSIETDNDTGLETIANIAVRVENLPDTFNAAYLAVVAAQAAYPTHPNYPCLVLETAGQYSVAGGGKTGLMVGRMCTTEAGTPSLNVSIPDSGAITVTPGVTGSVGGIALVRLTYSQQKSTATL